MKKLLVALSDDDHEMVARFASAMALPTIEAGAARIIAEWAGKQRIRDAARRQRRSFPRDQQPWTQGAAPITVEDHCQAGPLR